MVGSVVSRIKGAPFFLSLERIFSFSSHEFLILYLPGPGASENGWKTVDVFPLIEYFAEG